MENKKKASLVLNSSSRGMTNSISGMRKIDIGSRHKWSFTGSLNRKGSILAGHRGSKLSVLDDRTEAPKPVQVLDDNGNDVTPQPLYQEDPADKLKQRKNILEDIFSSMRSDHLKSSSTFNLPSASSFMGSSPSSSMRASMTKDSEDSVLEMPTLPPAPWEMPRKRDNVEQQVTEEMLDEAVEVFLHETDTITLLDIPPTFVSEDAEDAEAIEEQNIKYAELCKNRLGNDKYVVRFTQTFSDAPKNKQSQSDEIEMTDEGTMATAWDIYDSFLEKAETQSEETDFSECAVDTGHNQEKKVEKSSSCSTIITGSTVSSLFEKESCRSSITSEPDPQVITLSESFQQSLSVMERSITLNLMQPKLAAYRQLPMVEGPDSTVEPEEQMTESEESSSSPTLEPLWSFSCELTKGCSITCMALNHENMDLLAVGYGVFGSLTQKPGFICCWSIKSPTWPERFFHCHSGVTSLDFSAKYPSQLAVGMDDGTVALYNSTSLNSRACIADSSECPKRHMNPVCQVRCMKQQLSGEDGVGNVISVSMDGRISKWLFLSSSLDCMGADCEDLQELRGPENLNKTELRFLPAKDPGLSFDFHPTDSNIYLVGTTQGNIYKCSISDSQHFICTYKKHFLPVNHVEWSQFCPDVFLSCSSDWSVQLWRQDLFAPVLSFTSTQSAVNLVRWSPHWSSVFAALKGDRLEIWDLNSNILNPTLVHKAAPGVRFTSFLFANKTDCVLIGDSDGWVTVYQMKNLSVGEGEQGDSLKDIVTSVISKQL